MQKPDKDTEESVPEKLYSYDIGDPRLERMADEAHQVWAMWLENLFKSGTQYDRGHFLIHSNNVNRWRRQMETPYSQLPELEKESDRKVAQRYLDVADIEWK